MKKLLLVLIILLSGIIVQAQSTFAPVGAEWWYEGGHPEYPSQIMDYVKVTKDTIVAGQPCRKIETIRYQRYLIGNHISIGNRPNVYLYDQNDTIYVFNNRLQTFSPLFTFNVNIGDTICFPAYTTFGITQTNPITGDTSFCLTIDSINMHYADYYGYEAYHINAIHDFDSNSTNPEYIYPALTWYREPFFWGINYGQGMFMRTLGGKEGILPVRVVPSINSHEREILSLSCYQDGTTQIAPPGYNCAARFYALLGINSHHKTIENAHLFPNPATEQVTLRLTEALPKGSTIQLLDMTGRTLKSLTEIEHQQNITIDIRTLPPGLYMVRLQSQGQSSYKKLVVQ